MNTSQVLLFGAILAASSLLSPALTLRVESFEGGMLSLAIDDIPAGQTYHLRRSRDGETFESLSAPLDITAATPQPIVIPVDRSQEPTLFFQVYEGAAPIPFMEMVSVGNPGNAHDPEDGDRDTPGKQNFGEVDYAFRIGKYEVTNAQYADFLNAVARADRNNVFKIMMGTDLRAGLTRSGEEGSYTYTVRENMGDKPVIWVNFFDVVRFCNWLHNGRPTGLQDESTTEDGAYTLIGEHSILLPGTDPTHGVSGRNAGARFWLPSENEWYKAAYHQPAGQGGDADDYWLYATGSNTEPTIAVADVIGNIDNDTGNIANYGLGANWNGLDGNVTAVGSGGPGGESFYGASDMAGNLWEWNEQIIGGARGIRGGAWLDNAVNLQSSLRSISNPPFGNINLGFRVAAP